jgi:hypothetical protein
VPQKYGKNSIRDRAKPVKPGTEYFQTVNR